MAVFGSTINPALGRVDYSPLAQGLAQGGQLAAQGLSNFGTSVAQGIQTFLKKQEDKQNEQEGINFIKAQFPGIGDAEAKAGLKAAGGAAAFVKFRQDMAQNQMAQKAQALQIAEFERTAAERSRLAQAMTASPAQMAMAGGATFEQLPTGAGAFLSSAPANTSEFIKRAQEAKIDPSVWLPQAIQFSQVEENVGQAKARGAADLTAAQKDTEAIIASEIATGVLNPDDRTAISRRRAQLLSRGGRADRETERFQSVSSIVDESGNYLGQGVFDQKSGKFGLVNETTGEIEPLPKGAKPSTVSGMSRGMLSAPQFLQLRTKLGQDEIALGRLSEYFDSVEDSRQGIDLLADKITTAVKTLVTTQKLSPTELAQAKSAGELQALLGSTRLEVLGGGVLTENDAVRLILNLGGDINALRNKEVVRTQLARIYEDKYKTYKRDLEDYNVQVAGGYGAQGYKPAVSIDFDQKLLKTYKSPQAQKRDESMINSISKRIAELEAKMKSGGSSK